MGTKSMISRFSNNKNNRRVSRTVETGVIALIASIATYLVMKGRYMYAVGLGVLALIVHFNPIVLFEAMMCVKIMISTFFIWIYIVLNALGLTPKFLRIK